MLRTKIILCTLFISILGLSAGKPSNNLEEVKSLIKQKKVMLAFIKIKKSVKHSPNHDNKEIYYNLIDIIANNLARNKDFSSAIAFIRKNLTSIVEQKNQEYFLKKIGYLYAMEQKWDSAYIVSKHYIKNKKMDRYKDDMLYLMALSLDKQNKNILAKIAYEKLNILYPQHSKGNLAAQRIADITLLDLEQSAKTNDKPQKNVAIDKFLKQNKF